jgi:hypothetical protein
MLAAAARKPMYYRRSLLPDWDRDRNRLFDPPLQRLAIRRLLWYEPRVRGPVAQPDRATVS